jgi:hypothetical protein
MTKTPKDGGPAFPFNFPPDNPFGGEGMTLLDYIAAHALAGICANSYTPWAPDAADISDKVVARAAYELAAAMVAERGNHQ